MRKEEASEYVRRGFLKIISFCLMHLISQHCLVGSDAWTVELGSAEFIRADPLPEFTG